MYIKAGLYRGDSSVPICLIVSFTIFAYLFLLLFGQIDNIYNVEMDSLYFFLEGDSKGII